MLSVLMNTAYILEWAMQIANTTSPPLVTSISYGDTEDGYFNKFGDYSYIARMEVGPPPAAAACMDSC